VFVVGPKILEMAQKSDPSNDCNEGKVNNNNKTSHTLLIQQTTPAWQAKNMGSLSQIFFRPASCAIFSADRTLMTQPILPW